MWMFSYDTKKSKVSSTSKGMFLIIILIIGTSTGYDFKCPAKAEWKLKANVTCSFEENYVCLFNVLEGKFQDNCLGLDLSSEGSKLVFQPLFNLAYCDAKTFQPFVFTTHGNSDCLLLKSKCDEEGQVVYSNGSFSNDTVCRCDYTKGYTFVSNPKNSCFCKPTEEDCSCYRVKCAKLSQDYQCFDNEQDRTGTICPEIYPQINMPNNTATWDSVRSINKSNNRHHRTVHSSEKRFSYAYQVIYFLIAAMGLYIVLVVLIVYVFGASPTHQMKADNIIGSGDSVPVQFKDKKEYDDERHKIIDEIIREGECGEHFFARVMLVGRNGAGKTSLMRRLLWQNEKDVINIQSTDGIEIKKCNINVSNGNWSPHEKEDNDFCRIINQLLRERTLNMLNEEKGSEHNQVKYDFVQGLRSNNTDSKIVKDGNVIHKETTMYKCMSEQTGNTSRDANRSNNRSKTIKDVPKTDDNLPIGHKKSKGHNIMYDQKDNMELSTDYIIKSNERENESGKNEKIDNIISAIIETYLHTGDKEQQDTKMFCWLWDFAGKDDFLATHQLFMSKSAVYILVTDRLSSSTIENDCDDSAYWVRFWFEAIHCHRVASNEDHLDPPIIVVCTNKDELKNPSERHKRKTEFVDNLSKVLSKEMKSHLRNIYFVSNTEDDDTVFEKIREEVSRQAMNMKDWRRACPLRWLLFQQVVRKLKENDVPICTTTELKDIANNANIGINSDKEFKLCLQYFNEIGSIIYFEDAVLAEHVILDPKWLVNAFRCLVSDQIGNVTKVSDDWRKLRETGELTDFLVSALFRKDQKLKLLENTQILLEVMTRFDIVMNLKNSKTLYMPCMMEHRSFANVLKLFTGGSQPVIRTSWLCLEFDFLPPSFFNHILAWYNKIYQVSTITDGIIQNKSYALFRQVCIFDMDWSGHDKLVICEAPNIIALQVWNSNHSLAWLRRTFFRYINSLVDRYGLQISFSKALKCKDGDFTNNRKKLNVLLLEKYYWCVEHKKQHLSNDLIKSWDFGEELLELQNERCGKMEIEKITMLDVSAKLCPVSNAIHELYTKLTHTKEAWTLMTLRSRVNIYIKKYNAEQITIFVDNKKVIRINDISETQMTKTKLLFHIKGNTLKIRNTDTGDEEEIFIEHHRDVLKVVP